MDCKAVVKNPGEVTGSHIRMCSIPWMLGKPRQSNGACGVYEGSLKVCWIFDGMKKRCEVSRRKAVKFLKVLNPNQEKMKGVCCSLKKTSLQCCLCLGYADGSAYAW